MTDRTLLRELVKYDLVTQKKITMEEYERNKNNPDVAVSGDYYCDEYKMASLDDEKINQKILLGIFKNLRIIKNILLFFLASGIIIFIIYILSAL